MVDVYNQSLNSKHLFIESSSYKYCSFCLSDMNYEFNTAFDTPNNNGMNNGGDYFRSHYHHHTKSHSNGFNKSSKNNGHNRIDEIEEEPQPQQQQQQRIDDDYEINDVDRPKLLMWGLTKYKNHFEILFLYIIINF